MTPDKTTLDDLLRMAEVLRLNPWVGLADPLKAAAIITQVIWIRTLYPTRTAMIS